MHAVCIFFDIRPRLGSRLRRCGKKEAVAQHVRQRFDIGRFSCHSCRPKHLALRCLHLIVACEQLVLPSMIFTALGPDFPEDLINDLLGGDAIFLCGAGVSAPQLPSFKILVVRVYGRLGEERGF